MPAMLLAADDGTRHKRSWKQMTGISTVHRV